MFYQCTPSVTLGKKRLNILVILNIEIKMSKTINNGDVIEDFAQQKG